MGKLRVSKLRLYPPVGIQDMHHNVRREWLAKASCHTFVRGKGTLFANFPSWALTGCFVFRPLVTSMASQLLVQVKCFFFFLLFSPHCKATVIRAIRSTSQDRGTLGEGFWMEQMPHTVSRSCQALVEARQPWGLMDHKVSSSRWRYRLHCTKIWQNGYEAVIHQHKDKGVMCASLNTGGDQEMSVR